MTKSETGKIWSLDLGKKWGDIPWNKFDGWYISDLIDEMAAIREDIGTFTRIAQDKTYNDSIRNLAKKNLELYTTYMHQLKMEIENERYRQKRSKRL